MKKKKISKFRWLRWLILPLIAVFTFLLVRHFTKNPALTEKVYSQAIYPFFASVISRFSQLVPFSLDDTFYMVAIVSVFVLIVLVILKRISFGKSILFLLNGSALIYILFYWLWGFNYFRSDLNTRLKIPEANADIKEFNTVLKNLVAISNNSYTPFEATNSLYTDSLVEDSYKKLSPFLGVKYPMGKRRVKNITFSRFFASAAISGYFGPFFNEVHINSYLLPLEYPVIQAHEKAHQFGITNEAEANFYAWLVCSLSPSKELQYSANLYILNYFLYEGRNFESTKEIVKSINPNVKNDILKLQNHWKELRNEKIDRVATKANNIYLKTNNIKEGIENYTGVVKLVMDYSEDKQAQVRVRDLLQK